MTSRPWRALFLPLPPFLNLSPPLSLPPLLPLLLSLSLSLFRV